MTKERREELRGFLCESFGEHLDDWVTYIGDDEIDEPRFAVDVAELRELLDDSERLEAVREFMANRNYGDSYYQSWCSLEDIIDTGPGEEPKR